jgi:hypothetical protein
MKPFSILLFVFTLITNLLLAGVPAYRGASNPHYWGNKKPYEGYWQQDIHYKIKASLDEKKDVITGTEHIVYYNNSPDTIHHLFFNLYQNAFLEGSHLSNLQSANGYTPKYGKYETEGLGNEILNIQAKGKHLATETDGSIMKAFLGTPLKPGDSLIVYIAFKTYYSGGGETRRRMKSFKVQGKKHFNGAHWYPRLAVYDRKFGWCTDQHLNREFYGDFGTYEVELNMPADFVVEATGTLKNEAEVLPDDLRKKLDISNYWNNKFDTAVTFFIPKANDSARKTWKYWAINVHDFAWISGPSYRLYDSTINGVKVVAMVQEPHCSGWKNAVNFTHKVMQVYSRDFGQYGYPKMVVADCQDGMEYPMLTMDGGSDPDYRGLLAHEVGHNWFYGMVNNNETYRALLDEGFTQFLTSWAMEAIDGKYAVSTPSTNTYVAKYAESVPVREEKVYRGYLLDAMRENDPSICTHSDGFHGALGQGGGYRHVYSKTATMLYNLQYVLGDELFQNAMKHYFDQWSYCHPYVEDYRNSFINYTHVDLNWFFDQWLETSKNIDFTIKRVERTEYDSMYKISIVRNGNMQMPIDFTVYLTDGRELNFHVPNGWFVKKTNATILPKWIGWDEKLNQKYEVILRIDGKIKNIKIDPSGRMADINMLDNTLDWPIVFKVDSKINSFPDRHHYIIKGRPDLWYSNYDGVKIGAHFEGSYMRTKHNVSFDIWGNTGKGANAIRGSIFPTHQTHPINFRFSYSNPIDILVKKASVSLDTRFLEGLWLVNGNILKELSDKLNVSIGYKWMKRNNPSDIDYLYNPTDWENTLGNGSINVGLNYYNSKNKWNHHLTINLRSAAFMVAQSYSYVSAQLLHNTSVKNFDVKFRGYGRLGGGAYTPRESQLYLAQANPEEMQENKYMRSVFLFPQSMYTGYDQNSDHLQFGGGLNLRGYVGRDMPFNDKANGKVIDLYRGNSGISANLEVGFDKYLPKVKGKINEYLGMNTYLFGDFGMLGQVQLRKDGVTNFSYPIYDAGAGAALTIKKFWVFQNIKPLVLRLDMPFLLSEPSSNDKGANWAPRWVFGVNRAF